MRAFMVAILLSMFMSGVAMGDGWTIEGVDISTDELLSPSIVLDAGDNAHISYQQRLYDNNSALKYAYWNGTNWAITIVDSNSSSHYMAESSSLVLDNSGEPCIAYGDDASGGILMYATWTGSYWDIDVVESGLNYVPGVSLCLTGSSSPRIAFAYFDSALDVHLMYARYDAQWYVSTIDPSVGVGSGVSMGRASDVSPHVSYYDAANDDLKYSYLGSEYWYSFTIDEPENVGLNTSLALDSNDRPHISYEDYTNKDLKYAYYTGSAWVVQTVDSDGDLGHYCTSIALDGNNNPHISYYDSSNNDLKYAHYDGSTWEISTVDDGLFAGATSSITVDSNNEPHIAYSVKDGDNRIIRHAYYGPQGVEGGENPSNSDGIVLYAITPNPCNANASVSFALPVSSNVNLAVYDLNGRRVATLTEGVFPTGVYGFEINDLTSGVYFCTLQAGNTITSERFVVID